MIRSAVFLLIAVACTISFFSSAQTSSSSIVVRGDTIVGYFKARNLERNPSEVHFRANTSDDWRKFSAKEISAFYLFGDLHESHRVLSDFSSEKIEDVLRGLNAQDFTDSTLFLTAVVKSQLVSLFEFKDINHKTQYYPR